MAWWWCLVAAALSAAPSDAQKAAAAKVFKGTRVAVAATLKDPESARFRSLGMYLGQNGDRHVCGQFNAKNSFGGYVGFEDFILDVSEGAVRTKASVGVDGVDEETWTMIRNASCDKLLFAEPEKP